MERYEEVERRWSGINSGILQDWAVKPPRQPKSRVTQKASMTDGWGGASFQQDFGDTRNERGISDDKTQRIGKISPKLRIDLLSRYAI
jgi:hypothetical protein